MLLCICAAIYLVAFSFDEFLAIPERIGSFSDIFSATAGTIVALGGAIVAINLAQQSLRLTENDQKSADVSRIISEVDASIEILYDVAISMRKISSSMREIIALELKQVSQESASPQKIYIDQIPDRGQIIFDDIKYANDTTKIISFYSTYGHHSGSSEAVAPPYRPLTIANSTGSQSCDSFLAKSLKMEAEETFLCAANIRNSTILLLKSHDFYEDDMRFLDSISESYTNLLGSIHQLTTLIDSSTFNLVAESAIGSCCLNLVDSRDRFFLIIQRALTSPLRGSQSSSEENSKERFQKEKKAQENILYQEIEKALEVITSSLMASSKSGIIQKLWTGMVISPKTYEKERVVLAQSQHIYVRGGGLHLVDLADFISKLETSSRKGDFQRVILDFLADAVKSECYSSDIFLPEHHNDLLKKISVSKQIRGLTTPERLDLHSILSSDFSTLVIFSRWISVAKQYGDVFNEMKHDEIYYCLFLMQILVGGVFGEGLESSKKDTQKESIYKALLDHIDDRGLHVEYADFYIETILEAIRASAVHKISIRSTLAPYLAYNRVLWLNT